MARPDFDAPPIIAPPGANVRRMRLARGWSQRDLATRCNPPLDLTTIRRIETNAVFTADSLMRIATALGVPYQALLASRPTR